MSTILRSPQARIVLAALALYLLWTIWLFAVAPGKVSPQIDRTRARVNLIVTLPFRPERFHVLMFQRFGRVSGTTDDSVEVRGVDPQQLHAIARYYWVSRIDPIPQNQ